MDKSPPTTVTNDAISAEMLVDAIAALGVILFLDFNTLRFFGALPGNWIELVRQWLPRRQEIVEYLKSPSEAHRKRVGSAMLATIKARRGLPCIYLGELVNPKPSCGCGAMHKCAIYGECVVSGRGAGKWRVCTNCQNYKVD